ncbi:MAG: Nif11-like leader peptide family natural product precursor [Deltaproteobacteria bacterium]
MSKEQLNAFLARTASDPLLRKSLSSSDAAGAARLAVREGFDVTVGDLIRYKARATTWQLTDAELAVVEEWQPRRQPYWWQFIPDE